MDNLSGKVALVTGRRIGDWTRHCAGLRGRGDARRARRRPAWHGAGCCGRDDDARGERAGGSSST